MRDLLHAGLTWTGQNQQEGAWVGMAPRKLHGGLTFALLASMPVAGSHAKAEPLSSEVSQNCRAGACEGGTVNSRRASGDLTKMQRAKASNKPETEECF